MKSPNAVIGSRHSFLAVVAPNPQLHSSVKSYSKDEDINNDSDDDDDGDDDNDNDEFINTNTLSVDNLDLQYYQLRSLECKD
jgi:hypothetical protein